MTGPSKPIFYMLLFSGFILLLVLFAQPIQVFLLRGEIPLLFPWGTIALEERNLLLIIQGLMLLVIVPVYILTFIFSWVYRADNKRAKYDPDLVDHKIAEYIWWGVPLLMIAIIGTITWIKTHELDPFKPLVSDKKPIKIEVVALQWKWLFIYPEEKIATVNYIQVPENTPIDLFITSDAPMNSLWIPRLGGQIYAMPGMKTELHLIANHLGKFHGASANISGAGFAGMHFAGDAVPEKEFQSWVRTVQTSQQRLDWNSYQQLALPSENNPVSLYRFEEPELFQKIVMKYMNP